MLKRELKYNVKRLLLKWREMRINKGRRSYWKQVFTARNKEHFRHETILSKEEEKEILRYYENYGIKVLPIYHQFYKHCTGSVDVAYIPDDIYYTFIDPYFNDWKTAKFLDNKTYYHLMFPNVRQPDLLAYRQNGFWLNCNHRIITANDVLVLIRNADTLFVKQATDSEGGKNIFVIDPSTQDKEVRQIFEEIRGDIVIQKGVRQSAVLSKLNASSVNTLRLLTLLRKDGTVKLCSTSLRMGINGAKVDNASSGGITVGVMHNGRLKEKAYSADGSCYTCHPTSGVKFNDIAVPNFTDAVGLVIEEAAKAPHFRLISWDIALDDNDRPVLIEANLKYGELEFHQLNNGPVFGDETEEILNEVFKK